jgi:hypothetical protein
LRAHRSDEAIAFNGDTVLLGFGYDNAGNLTDNKSGALATFDALNRLTARGGTTTRSTQDLAAPLSQILQAAGTNDLYGTERLAAVSGAVRRWYMTDALGSGQRTPDEAGQPTRTQSYDPWVGPQGGMSPGVLGFTGKLQQGSDVHLRVRWYIACCTVT